jgi:hypothetical protein
LDRGYVKNWRKIKDEPWYTQPLTAHLAQHLIREANHKDKKIIWNRREITVKRGQLITGRDRLSHETGLSHQNIRTSLEILKNSEFLTIKSTNKFSIITICNYGKYQDQNLESNQQSNQQTTSKQPAANHKQECIKNDQEKNSFVGAGAPTTKEGKKEKEFSEESIEYQLTNRFLQGHLKLDPDFKVKGKLPDLQKWSIPIDGLVRIEGKKPEQVRAVIDWLFSDYKQANFYRKITKSTASLRERFSTLVDFMNDDAKSNHGDDNDGFW